MSSSLPVSFDARDLNVTTDQPCKAFQARFWLYLIHSNLKISLE